jgi:hypothetical protein
MDRFLKRTRDLRKARKLSKKAKPMARRKRVNSYVIGCHTILKVLWIYIVIEGILFFPVKAVQIDNGYPIF